VGYGELRSNVRHACVGITDNASLLLVATEWRNAPHGPARPTSAAACVVVRQACAEVMQAGTELLRVMV